MVVVIYADGYATAVVVAAATVPVLQSSWCSFVGSSVVQCFIEAAGRAGRVGSRESSGTRENGVGLKQRVPWRLGVSAHFSKGVFLRHALEILVAESVRTMCFCTAFA